MDLPSPLRNEIAAGQMASLAVWSPRCRAETVRKRETWAGPLRYASTALSFSSSSLPTSARAAVSMSCAFCGAPFAAVSALAVFSFVRMSFVMGWSDALPCVCQKPKLGRSGDEVRLGWQVT